MGADLHPRLLPAPPALSTFLSSLPQHPSLAKAPQVPLGLSPSPPLGPQAPLRALHLTMSVAVEIFGFFMAALGLLMLGVTLPHSYWRVSTVHGSVITTNTIFENLWFSCATDSLGVYSCREFPSLLALSGMGWRERGGPFQGAAGGGERPPGRVTAAHGRALGTEPIREAWIELGELGVPGGPHLEPHWRPRPTCPPALV